MQKARHDRGKQTCSMQDRFWPLRTMGMQQRKVCCTAWLTCAVHGCAVKLGAAQTGGAGSAHAAGTWPSSPAAGTPARTASRAPAAPCTPHSRSGRQRRLWRRRARRRSRRGSLAARMPVSEAAFCAPVGDRGDACSHSPGPIVLHMRTARLRIRDLHAPACPLCICARTACQIYEQRQCTCA